MLTVMEQYSGKTDNITSEMGGEMHIADRY